MKPRGLPTKVGTMFFLLPNLSIYYYFLELAMGIIEKESIEQISSVLQKNNALLLDLFDCCLSDQNATLAFSSVVEAEQFFFCDSYYQLC